jgi:hypothetical protein
MMAYAYAGVVLVFAGLKQKILKLLNLQSWNPDRG